MPSRGLASRWRKLSREAVHRARVRVNLTAGGGGARATGRQGG